MLERDVDFIDETAAKLYTAKTTSANHEKRKMPISWGAGNNCCEIVAKKSMSVISFAVRR